MNRPCPTRILVVSLKHAGDRRRTFADRARDAGLEWEYFDACETLAPELVYDEAEARLRKGRPLSAGELGCYSSHYTLWQKLLADTAEQYIVLEDDVIVDWSMLRAVARTDLIASGIEYLRLYYKLPCPYIQRKRRFLTRTRTLIELTGAAYGTQGYVITRAAAEKFVDYCRRATHPIDDQMDRFWDHGVPNLCLFPFPLIEEAGASTIGEDRFVPKEESWRRARYLKQDERKQRRAIRERMKIKKWPAPAMYDES